ncbi:serine hydrolase domain-containing protein [Lysobacter claricitrinus]|uniref:serine hydrolase domain-containing protein n=1 Tax=Lysobacter claricitrinus TaxID=3367728 RepID=UPI0037DAF591
MIRTLLIALLQVSTPALAAPPKLPSTKAIDAEVARVMARTGAQGVAIAVIDGGKVVHVNALGKRNAKGGPLRTDTVMYGASLTKTVFAYTVMRLVDQRRIDLDTPIANDLDKPLPDYDTEAIHHDKYGPYKDLAGDERWRAITPRMVLTHSTGFLNFYWLEPDQKLRIHFDPGSRYSYSGEGMILLQFAIDNGVKSKGLGVDVGELARDNVFAPLGMTRTSLMWRPDFAGNLADGWTDTGEAKPHDERSKVRAAGSMDTTIDDLSKFAAALVSGTGLSAKSRAEMVKPQLHIATATQFPPLQDELPANRQRKDLAAGLGVIVFDGPQGHGFFKGGHDEQTANTLVCVEARRRCVLILANDVRAEAGFADLVRFVLGDTGVPFDWEYGTRAGKS